MSEEIDAVRMPYTYLEDLRISLNAIADTYIAPGKLRSEDAEELSKWRKSLNESMDRFLSQLSLLEREAGGASVAPFVSHVVLNVHTMLLGAFTIGEQCTITKSIKRFRTQKATQGLIKKEQNQNSWLSGAYITGRTRPRAEG